MADHKDIAGIDGAPLKGVRYTEARLAQCFEPGADAFHVLQLLAHQQLTVYGAAKAIQHILKGHKPRLTPVDYTRKLAPYIDHEARMEQASNGSDASELE